jgi:hypothetical protein
MATYIPRSGNPCQICVVDGTLSETVGDRAKASTSQYQPRKIYGRMVMMRAVDTAVVVQIRYE